MTLRHRELRDHLLAETLQYAIEKIPFYRELSNARNGELRVLKDFPLLTKADVAAHFWELISLERFPDYMMTSGGTDEQTPSVTFRNADEYESVFEFFAGQRRSELLNPESLTEFTLDIFHNSNGYYWRKPYGWPLLSVVLERPAHAEAIKALIRDGVIIKGRSIPARHIQCQNGPLKTLTGYFWATHFMPRDFGISSVLVYGAFLPSVWRQRLQDIWGVQATTIYGLSELAVGNAMECYHCHNYHYWTAWPEFISLRDHHSTKTAGDALLVLTSLVPFSYVQPRIRFVTGDIVTLTGHCDAANQNGFAFRGRVQSSIFSAVDERVIFSEIEILDVLEELPDINCRAHASEGPLWSSPSVPRPPFRLGTPRFNIREDAESEKLHQVTVTVEVTFEPSRESARARKLHNTFYSVLDTKFPNILEELNASNIKLSVKCVPPGTLLNNPKQAT